MEVLSERVVFSNSSDERARRCKVVQVNFRRLKDSVGGGESVLEVSGTVNLIVISVCLAVCLSVCPCSGLVRVCFMQWQGCAVCLFQIWSCLPSILASLQPEPRAL